MDEGIEICGNYSVVESFDVAATVDMNDTRGLYLGINHLDNARLVNVDDVLLVGKCGVESVVTERILVANHRGSGEQSLSCRLVPSHLAVFWHGSGDARLVVIGELVAKSVRPFGNSPLKKFCPLRVPVMREVNPRRIAGNHKLYSVHIEVACGIVTVGVEISRGISGRRVVKIAEHRAVGVKRRIFEKHLVGEKRRVGVQQFALRLHALGRIVDIAIEGELLVENRKGCIAGEYREIVLMRIPKDTARIGSYHWIFCLHVLCTGNLGNRYWVYLQCLARAYYRVRVENKIVALCGCCQVGDFAVAAEAFAVEGYTLIKSTLAAEYPFAFFRRGDVEAERQILLHRKGNVHIVENTRHKISFCLHTVELEEVETIELKRCYLHVEFVAGITFGNQLVVIHVRSIARDDSWKFVVCLASRFVVDGIEVEHTFYIFEHRVHRVDLVSLGGFVVIDRKHSHGVALRYIDAKPVVIKLEVVAIKIRKTSLNLATDFHAQMPVYGNGRRTVGLCLHHTRRAQVEWLDVEYVHIVGLEVDDSIDAVFVFHL